jgi:hypothetical protein
MTAIFRGDREVVQLGFWSDTEKGRAVSAVRSFDWTAHRFAAVLEVFDGSYESCFHQLAPGMTRVSGRVTSSTTALPLAGVDVIARLFTGVACPTCTAVPKGPHEPTMWVAKTDADGRYSFDWRRGLPDPIRVSFDGGSGYHVAWWRDASSVELATDLAVSGAQRNMAVEGIDSRLEPPTVPSGAVINLAQRYVLDGATTVTITRCLSSQSATYCLNTTKPARRDAALVAPFARVLDSELARVRPEAPATDYVLLVIGFGNPPSPGDFRPIAGTFKAFVYDDARGLLTIDTPRDEIAVRAPEAFVRLVASSR